MPNRYLIFGCNGMLAQAVRRKLTDDPRAQTITCARDECDVTDAAAVRDYVNRQQPTVVVNCAAMTNVDGCETQPELAHAVNAVAAQNVARSAAQVGAVVVHFSTDFVFDGAASHAYNETDRPNPQSVYGKTKFEGEQWVAEANPNHLILRTAWLFGRPGKNFVRTMVERARLGQLLRVVSDQHGCPTFTDDLADSALRLIKTKASGLFHVAGAKTTTWHEFTLAALAVFHLPPLVEPITTAEWTALKPAAAPRPLNSALDCTKLSDATGLVPQGYDTALPEYRRQVDALGF